jgi:3-oxoacyl-[acyl-carrier protein] reductase
MTTTTGRCPAMADLTGMSAVVTGSSRGIGRGIALLLAAHGARVVVHGRNPDAVQEVRQAIQAAGGTALGVLADLTDADAVERLRNEVGSAWGTPDIVVVNAGGSPVRPGPVEELSLEDFHASIDGNLTATFLTVKAFTPGMKQRGSGVIVTMSSAAARRPDARSPVAYAAAKAAIELLTKDLAAQAGPFGIRVNCVAPETILTESNQQLIPPALQAELAAAHPARRLGTVDDVAQAVLFLASEQSAWVTGITLDVAGGSVLR